MFKNELSEKKINEILENYENTKNAVKVIESYRDACPNFKNGKCEGAIDVNSRSGCNSCIKEGKHDLNNARPPITDKWAREEYEKEKLLLLLDAVRNCNLSFDESFCKYKYVFNYCSFCNKEFRRKER